MSGAQARLFIVLLCAGVLLAVAVPAAAQAAGQPSITFPVDGQVVQGQVPVKGTTQIPGFASSELAFAYVSDPTQTWFILQTASLPVTDDTLAVWDSTQLSDGDYILRLRVALMDGSLRETTTMVRVRNYTPIPSPSPAVTPTEKPVVEIPTAMIILASETPTLPAPAPAVTPTSLPPNPAGITPAAIYSVFWRGALVVGLLVLLFGALVRSRR